MTTASSDQVTAINRRLNYMGYTRISDRPARLAACAWLLGLKGLDSTKKLTTTQARHLQDALARVKDRAELEKLIRLSSMLEDEVDDYVREECDRRRLHAFHVEGHRIPGATSKPRSPAGYPDWTIVGDEGILWAECKAEEGRVRGNQTSWHKRLRRGGGDVVIWRPSDMDSGVIARELDRIAGRPAART
jgi:hypothetical protein